MGRILGLRGARTLTGVGVSCLILAAGCTQVVSGKATVDEGAASSFASAQSSSSSVSSVSASSSKAAATKQTFCNTLTAAVDAEAKAWHGVVDAWNNSDRDAISPAMDLLNQTAKSAAALGDSITSDLPVDIATVGKGYASAAKGVVDLFGRKQITANDLNNAQDAVSSAGQLAKIACGS